ncbi:hypothetical protein [Peribacillus loiseleuriae]|uniref:hypothetical protein n=1 Tax=Peribacillus loiseleuriae TaxID=1679170 RepID=UPI003D046DE2
MKKFLVLLAMLLMISGLAACSSKENGETNAEKASSPEKTDLKKEMVKFYTELGNTINAKDVDLNRYEADVAKATEDPTVTIKPEEKTKASESATAVVDALKKVQVPAVLKDQKTDLEAALKDYIASYQMKADELKKDSPSLDEANATFKQGDEKLGKALESVKMLPASLDAQVN